MLKQLSQDLFRGLVLAVLAIVALTACSHAVYLWGVSPSPPPAGNVSTPLNATTTGQMKQGNLALNTTNTWANALLIPYGNVGIGVSNPTQKLQVNGQIYASLPGTTGGIRFADNTVQTTAIASSKIPCNWPNGWDFSCAAGGMPRVFCENGFATQLSMTPACGAGGSFNNNGERAGEIWDGSNWVTHTERDFGDIGINLGGGTGGNSGDFGGSTPGGHSGSYGDGSCFVGGTKIAISENMEKEIRLLNEGDSVLSFDTKNGKSVINKVLKKYQTTYTGEFIVVNSNIKVTPKHPFYINNEWQEIGKAKEGDYLQNKDGNQIKIETIRRITDTEQIFNLHIDRDNNYYAEGFLVHNKW